MSAERSKSKLIVGVWAMEDLNTEAHKRPYWMQTPSSVDEATAGGSEDTPRPKFQDIHINWIVHCIINSKSSILHMGEVFREGTANVIRKKLNLQSREDLWTVLFFRSPAAKGSNANHNNALFFKKRFFNIEVIEKPDEVGTDGFGRVYTVGVTVTEAGMTEFGPLPTYDRFSFKVMGVHLKKEKKNAAQQLKDLRESILAKADDLPLLVLGDFNLLAKQLRLALELNTSNVEWLGGDGKLVHVLVSKGDFKRMNKTAVSISECGRKIKNFAGEEETRLNADANPTTRLDEGPNEKGEIVEFHHLFMGGLGLRSTIRIGKDRRYEKDVSEDYGEGKKYWEILSNHPLLFFELKMDGKRNKVQQDKMTRTPKRSARVSAKTRRDRRKLRKQEELRNKADQARTHVPHQASQQQLYRFLLRF